MQYTMPPFAGSSDIKVVAKVIATAFLPPYSQCYFNELGVVYR
jgi:hypothetical protein